MLTVAGRLILAVLVCALCAPLAVAPAFAGDPEVLEVVIESAGEEGELRFFNVEATIRHADEGWRHYADAFEVLDAATGKLLGVRKLMHPHEHEQPFTRSLYRMETPREVTRVIVRAHDKVHGYSKEPLEVDLPD